MRGGVRTATWAFTDESQGDDRWQYQYSYCLPPVPGPGVYVVQPRRARASSQRGGLYYRELLRLCHLGGTLPLRGYLDHEYRGGALLTPLLSAVQRLLC